MWNSNENLNRTFYTIRELTFDTTSGFHSYRLTINEDDDNSLPNDWTLMLYIDGEAEALLSGVTDIGPEALILLSTYSRNGQVAPITDWLNPPSTEAIFRNLKQVVPK